EGDGTTVVVLSGGNVDAGLLGDIGRRHESLEGRRLVLLARIPDRPGALAMLLTLVGEHGANLRDVQHIREGIDLHVRETAVQLVLETRSRLHAGQVVEAVRAAGYSEPRLIDQSVRATERASSTSAPTTRLFSSASGCHCTPSTNRWPGSSTASGRSSRVER